MKIATYNILRGGFNSYDSKSIHPERLRLLQEAVKEINADFLGLIDTTFWTERFNSDEVKNLFNYPNVFMMNLDDPGLNSSVGITVLSKIPIKELKIIRIDNRNCIKAELKVNGKIIDIFTIYLDDKKEEIRLKQIKALLSQVKKSATVVMGDFNSVSKEESPNLIEKIRWFFTSVQNLMGIIKHVKQIIPEIKTLYQAKVINLIKSSGFKEPEGVGKSKLSFPTPLFMNLNLNKPFVQIDYIFSTPDIKIKNYNVLEGKVFEKASDHYPVVGEIII